MYKKIYNPETGRKVNVNGKLGKKILRKYLYVLNGGSGRNPSSATLNLGYLKSVGKIKLTIMSPKAPYNKGVIETTRKTPLKDLVDKVSNKVSIDRDNLKLIKEGIEIWPINSPGNILLEDLGITQDGAIYYIIILRSLAEALKTNDANKKTQAKKQAEIHRTDLIGWEDAMKDTEDWALSDDDDDDTLDAAALSRL